MEVVVIAAAAVKERKGRAFI